MISPLILNMKTSYFFFLVKKINNNYIKILWKWNHCLLYQTFKISYELPRSFVKNLKFLSETILVRKSVSLLSSLGTCLNLHWPIRSKTWRILLTKAEFKTANCMSWIALTTSKLLVGINTLSSFQLWKRIKPSKISHSSASNTDHSPK